MTDVPPEAFLVDRATVVTLRTLCGCERTFLHRDRSMLSREWVVPLPPPPAIQFDPDPPGDVLLRWPRRTFRLVHISENRHDPLPHYVYEEVQS